jgi:gliding motility-associated-like protein
VDDLTLNASTNLTGTTGTYSWSPNYNIINANTPRPTISPDRTTTYVVSYSDEQGCRNRDSVVVRVVDSVRLRTGNDTTICRTDSILLKVDSDALIYRWTNGQTLNNPNIKTPLASPTETFTTYEVTGNIGSCVGRDQITVKTVPYPDVQVSNDTSICYGTNASLRATGGSIYQWLTTRYISDPSVSNPTIIQPDSGVYRYVVSVRDTFGCPLPVFDSIKLNVIHIIADAGPRDTNIVVNQILQLNATGSTIYRWSPSRWLNNPNIANPKSKPEGDIEYVVTVSNNIGCFDKDSIRVKFFNLAAGFYVPNAFSPNTDGLNDRIRPMALGLKSLERFSIFNRWGKLMFTTSQIGAGWDGFLNGKKQEPGTYVWFAEGTVFPDANTNVSVPIKGNGTFILLR